LVRGDRTQAVGLSTKVTITDFTPYARPAGGNRILLMQLSQIAIRPNRAVSRYRHR
jgi:hypothetical protein